MLPRKERKKEKWPGQLFLHHFPILWVSKCLCLLPRLILSLCIESILFIRNDLINLHTPKFISVSEQCVFITLLYSNGNINILPQPCFIAVMSVKKDWGAWETLGSRFLKEEINNHFKAHQFKWVC